MHNLRYRTHIPNRSYRHEVSGGHRQLLLPLYPSAEVRNLRYRKGQLCRRKAVLLRQVNSALRVQRMKRIGLAFNNLVDYRHNIAIGMLD